MSTGPMDLFLLFKNRLHRYKNITQSMVVDSDWTAYLIVGCLSLIHPRIHVGWYCSTDTVISNTTYLIAGVHFAKCIAGSM